MISDMKRFCDLEIGDKIYFLAIGSKEIYISEICDIETGNENELIFYLLPIIGPKKSLTIRYSQNSTFIVTKTCLVFISEIAFSIFKEFINPDEEA